MFDKIHCFNVSFNGYLPSSALTIIFLVEMFKTPRSLLRNCKRNPSASVLSEVEKFYPLYGFQTSLPHKRIGKIKLSKRFSAIFNEKLVKLTSTALEQIWSR